MSSDSDTSIDAAKRERPRPALWKRVLLALPLRARGYRPERHYMRGPGPKWRELHPLSEWAHDPANIA
jgi:hypothetical protein